jgi:hypothetical protein
VAISTEYTFTLAEVLHFTGDSLYWVVLTEVDFSLSLVYVTNLLWSGVFPSSAPLERSFFFYGSIALYGPGPPRFVEVSWSHTFETHHSR